MMNRQLTSRIAGGIGVLEAEPFLAPELQRQFTGEEIAVRSFWSISDLAAMVRPRVCVLSVECDQNGVAEFVQQVHQDSATACVVVSSGRFTEWEWSLREIGAASVVNRFVRGDELATICRKLLNSRITNEHSSESHV